MKRRNFIKKTALTTAGAFVAQHLSSKISVGEEKTAKDMMVGMQLDADAFANRSFDELFEEMKSLAPINSIHYFFKDTDVKLSPQYMADTPFSCEKLVLDKNGDDTIDLMYKSLSKKGLELFLGGGELYWDDCTKFPSACQIDCYGNRRKTSCVNNPEWKKFQLSVHADIFKEHLYLNGFLFMHERTGPFMQIFKPEPWQGVFNPGCFCVHCAKIAQEKGINAEKAKKGFKKLIKLLRDKDPKLRRDGVMVGLWRIICQFPEVMAWEQFQWDSLKSYRIAFSENLRKINPEISIGYHFQHSASSGDFPWRAGDNPESAIEFADWVKPSIYPGCSGTRYKDLLDKSHDTYLADMNEQTAHEVLCAWFGRSAKNGVELIGTDTQKQAAFSSDWCKQETERFVKGCQPLPVYAGLGIGIPGGENTETKELIQNCTEACFQAGAKGILFSRHYSEIKPELLNACGEIINKYL